MASTLIINGRRFTAGGDRTLSTEVLQPPLGYTRIRDPNWEDGPYKLRYRLFDKAHEHENWMTMPDLKQLVQRDEAWVIEMVKTGKLYAGMKRGSGIPLFRILDRGAVIRETILEAAPRVEMGSRKTKDRWDK